MTPAEKHLWSVLRNRQLDDTRFRRQHPLGSYILAIVCTEQRLIIEVDDGVHDEQMDYDAARTEHLEQFGYRVPRFRNDDVLYDSGSVLRKIWGTSAF